MSKRLTAKVGEYEKDGQTKGRYVDLGVIMENSNGEYILLDPSVNLAGVLLKQNAIKGDNRTSVMVSVFDSDRQQAPQQNTQSNQQQSGNGSFDEGVPF